MKTLLVVIFGLGLLVASETKPSSAARFDGYKVYRIKVNDVQQLSDLQKLGDNLPLHYLNEFKGLGSSYDVVIDPANQYKLEAKLHFLKFEFSCVIDDLQSILEEESHNRSEFVEGTNSTEMNWTKYHGLAVIYSWLKKIEIENPHLVTSFIIGYSYEGRPIRAIKISFKPGNKAIFVDSGIHAIEWISPAAFTCVFNNLLKSSDERMIHLRQNYDWIYVPVVNPDGYEYSHNVFRLWRKNRRPTGSRNILGSCIGVDLNRNFDYQWGVAGFNVNSSCSNFYGGPSAASEPEVIAFKHFFNSFPKDYIIMYLAIHSFGNEVLLPHGDSKALIPHNMDKLLTISKAYGDGVRTRYGTKIASGASCDLSYPVSGDARDWVYALKKAKFSATVELRDDGRYGFFLPSRQILQVCAEVIDGLVAMVAKAREEGLFDN